MDDCWDCWTDAEEDKGEKRVGSGGGGGGDWEKRKERRGDGRWEMGGEREVIKQFNKRSFSPPSPVSVLLTYRLNIKTPSHLIILQFPYILPNS